MKRRFVFLWVILGVLIFCIIVLAMLNRNKVEDEVEEKIHFESKDTIRLYRKDKGKLETLNLNYYLYCVVASEMPFKYEYEALKAQAIVARTYLYNKIKNNAESEGDVCDDYSHCQAYTDIDVLEGYWRKKGFSDKEIEEGEEKIKKAIVETEGRIITYDNQIIDAVFHASSPERTEDASAIWSGVDIPYLKSVENVEDEDYERRTSEKIVNYATFKNTLIDNGYIKDLTREEFESIKINEYTSSGRVKNIKVGRNVVKAENLRTLFGLNSTNFTLEVDRENIKFNVLGFGHGVGLSQVGADKYAKQGLNCDEIIHHYYTDVDIVNVND